MSPDSVTAERVYRALKANLLYGRVAPGASINVHAMAGELDLSISPVRDALHRLIGERIVSMRRGGGFELPNVSIESVAELYAWHGRLVMAIEHEKGNAPEFDQVETVDESDTVAMADVTTLFFKLLAGRAGNAEHAMAIRSAGERLYRFRLREMRLPGRSVELATMARRARDGDIYGLRRAVMAYHRRRVAHASTIVELLYSPAFPPLD